MIKQKVRKKQMPFLMLMLKESQTWMPMYSKQINKMWSLKSLLMLSVRLELVYMQYNISDSQALF